MKKLGAVLVLWACTLPLSACAILETGPCYGAGCPAFTTSKGAPAAPPAAQSAPAQDPPATANAAPVQKKHHKFWLF
jgi:hypothetical protein